MHFVFVSAVTHIDCIMTQVWQDDAFTVTVRQFKQTSEFNRGKTEEHQTLSLQTSVHKTELNSNRTTPGLHLSLWKQHKLWEETGTRPVTFLAAFSSPLSQTEAFNKSYFQFSTGPETAEDCSLFTFTHTRKSTVLLENCTWCIYLYEHVLSIHEKYMKHKIINIICCCVIKDLMWL